MEHLRETWRRVTAKSNTLYRGMELRGINADDEMIEAMRSGTFEAFVVRLVREVVAKADVSQWSMRMGDSGKGVGVHWTTDLGIAKSFSTTGRADRFVVAMFDSWLSLVIEATYTPGDEVVDPEQNSHAYGWDGRDEKEVPLRAGAPLTLTKVYVRVPANMARFVASYDTEGEASTSSVKWLTIPLGFSAVASTHLRDQWRKTAISGTYWRVHSRNRPFSLSDAFSVPMSSFGDRDKTNRQARPGYSCMANPWHLWVYCLAMGWLADGYVQDSDVIEFSGRPITKGDFTDLGVPESAIEWLWDGGRGVDSEPLVMPDMRTVRKQSWSSFEKMLLGTPLPSGPQASDVRFNSGLANWSDLAEILHERKGRYARESGPVIDFLIGKFILKKSLGGTDPRTEMYAEACAAIWGRYQPDGFTLTDDLRTIINELRHNVHTGEDL